MRRIIAALTGLFMAGAATAEALPPLALELNAAELVGESCRLTFVLSSGLEQDIDGLVAETVLFSDDGAVILLTLFDFGQVPAGRPRVRQFQVPDTACDRIGQVLVNGIATCTIAGAASSTCSDALGVSSRLDIRMEG